MDKIDIERKIVIINQAVNYLTVDICNAFFKKFENVELITGNVHEQGMKLNGSVKIKKIKRYDSSSPVKKFFSYLYAYISISWLLLFKYRRHEVFFVSLPPMAYLISLLVKNRCSILVWDIYPDALKITGMSEKNLIYRLLAAGNQKAFKNAYRLYTIGKRMAESLTNYVSKEKIKITPLWSIFDGSERIAENENSFIDQENLKDKFVVQYSGNIGFTHNVEQLIEIAELLKQNKKICFQIIGKGTRLSYLKKLAMDKKLENLKFIPFQPDYMFPYTLSAANLGVVILDDVTSKGSVPSKTYNLMSFGIPILYLAAYDSELNDYSIKYKNGKTFNKRQTQEAALFISKLSQDQNYYLEMANNSKNASMDFSKKNADKIVQLYLAQ